MRTPDAPRHRAWIDYTATAAELGVVLALVTVLPRRTARWVIPLLMLGGMALWVARLTDVLL